MAIDKLKEKADSSIVNSCERLSKLADGRREDFVRTHKDGIRIHKDSQGLVRTSKDS